MWEPLSNPPHTKEVISNFTRAHPNAPHCLNMAYLDFVHLFHQYDLSIVYDGHNIPFNHMEVDL